MTPRPTSGLRDGVRSTAWRPQGLGVKRKAAAKGEIENIIKQKPTLLLQCELVAQKTPSDPLQLRA